MVKQESYEFFFEVCHWQWPKLEKTDIFSAENFTEKCGFIQTASFVLPEPDQPCLELIKLWSGIKLTTEYMTTISHHWEICIAQTDRAFVVTLL